MRKLFVLVVGIVMSMSSVLGASAAEGTKQEQFNLIDEKSGYKLVVPNFVELRTIHHEVEGETYDGPVIVIKQPDQNSDGTYTLFQIVTTDKKARFLESWPAYLLEGQAGGSVYGEFSKDGKFNYNVKKPMDSDQPYTFSFDVYDKDIYADNVNQVFTVNDVNVMFVDSAVVAQPADKPTVPTASKVTVNGKEVAFEAYNIDGNNFFKLRDLAAAVNGSEKQFEVAWDGANNAIGLLSKKGYTEVGGELAVSSTLESKTAVPTSSRLTLDGKELQLTAYNIDGNNYFKLRDIAKALNIGVTWDGTTNRIGIETKLDYVEQ